MTRSSIAKELVLLAITDFTAVPERTTLERWARLAALASPGSVAVSLRDRTLSPSRLLELGARLHATARLHGQGFVVNDRLDLAALLEADGVHLGEGSVETRDARQLLPEACVIRACHASESVAELAADIVLLSPILEPQKGNPVLGLEGLRRARRALEERRGDARLFALGGVDAARARACRAAGADGVAAISAAFSVEDPSALLSELGILRHAP